MKMTNTLDESIRKYAKIVGQKEAHQKYQEFNEAYRKKHGCFTENGEDYFQYLDKKEKTLQKFFNILEIKYFNRIRGQQKWPMDKTSTTNAQYAKKDNTT